MKLLLAAFPPELGPLHGAPPEGWAVACTGVGALTAAAATARLLAELKPEAVVFVGTCGRYDPRVGLGEAVWAAAAVASSVEERRGGAYRPGIETVRWAGGLPNPAGLREAVAVVPPAITATAEGAALLAPLGEVEHLELTGVYAACAAAGVPAGAALAVVNDVGPEAHAQWKANHAEGSRRLIAALAEAGLFGPR